MYVVLYLQTVAHFMIPKELLFPTSVSHYRIDYIELIFDFFPAASHLVQNAVVEDDK